MKDSSQDSAMIRKPSLRLMRDVLWTKMKGKTPTRKVIAKLISSGVMALSAPSMSETPTDRSMNSALTRSAMPTFLDTTLRFIFRL